MKLIWMILILGGVMLIAVCRHRSPPYLPRVIQEGHLIYQLNTASDTAFMRWNRPYVSGRVPDRTLPYQDSGGIRVILWSSTSKDTPVVANLLLDTTNWMTLRLSNEYRPFTRYEDSLIRMLDIAENYAIPYTTISSFSLGVKKFPYIHPVFGMRVVYMSFALNGDYICFGGDFYLTLQGLSGQADIKPVHPAIDKVSLSDQDASFHRHDGVPSIHPIDYALLEIHRSRAYWKKHFFSGKGTDTCWEVDMTQMQFTPQLNSKMQHSP